MAITLNHNGNVLEVRVRDKLTHADYQQFTSQFEALLASRGKLNVLFEMVDFHGWEIAALWDETKFDVKHFSDIARIAMVGDKKWEKGMSVFARLFTAANVRYFDARAIDEARAWLASR